MDIDSDFYGDEEVKSDLTRRVEQLDTQMWWDGRRAAAPVPQSRQQETPDTSHLHNAYDGVPHAWQLSETLDDFFSRLPPLTTIASPDTPWIYICNPHVVRKHKSDGQNQHSKGNENEGTEEEGSNLAVANEGGMERLHILSNFIRGALTMGGGSAAVMRDVENEKQAATGDILNLAWACKVRCGKWMIFCDPKIVNDTWEIVARATANNELGIAAKVAPCPDESLRYRERLICVYTKDFADRRDVGRVIRRLRELRLVEARGKTLYYKPDIFTYIGLDSGNPWGLRSSIYSSRDVFPST
ncbi:uncharacterized protein DNG_04015 [Cephalotrichum gorgonifer]|uniref:DUF1917 domain-containing protein n=1 Tax=Cephalotrichum gorgonifer TaxID=2041049 RepID=A0AAE8MXM4_9PEZI|nr:uncharacterized protein DNG_04015 [Cephalotrichum gorgonifer]